MRTENWIAVPVIALIWLAGFAVFGFLHNWLLSLAAVLAGVVLGSVGR